MRKVSLGLLGAALIAIGCGGGGGGGTTTTTTTGTTTSGTTGNDGVNAFVAGRVVIDGFAAGIPNVGIRYLDSTGGLLGTTTTDANGNFGLNVSPAAAEIQIDQSSINTGLYYVSFRYNGRYYAPNIASCGSPLPALAAATDYNIGTISLILRSDPPPPPPDGCR